MRGTPARTWTRSCPCGRRPCAALSPAGGGRGALLPAGCGGGGAQMPAVSHSFHCRCNHPAVTIATPNTGVEILQPMDVPPSPCRSPSACCSSPSLPQGPEGEGGARGGYIQLACKGGEYRSFETQARHYGLWQYTMASPTSRHAHHGTPVTPVLRKPHPHVHVPLHPCISHFPPRPSPPSPLSHLCEGSLCPPTPSASVRSGWIAHH